MLPASAATWSGLGDDNNFNNGANWVGGIAPTAGTATDYLFTGTPSRLAPNINANNYTASSITFDASAGSFNITNSSGASQRFLIPVDSGATITQNSANDQSIVFIYQGGTTGSAPITIAGSGAGSLTLGNLRFGPGNNSSQSNILNIQRDVIISQITRAQPNQLNTTSTFNVSSGATATVSAISGGSDSSGFILEKTGAGVMLLQGANTATGGTTNVSAGILAVANTQALGTSQINVSGGRLRLDSNLSAGGNFTLGSSGALQMTLAQQITFTAGSLTLTDGASFFLADLATNTFQLSDLFSGYSSATVGTNFFVNNQAATYAGGTFTVIPEPSVAVLAGMGLLFLLVIARRRLSHHSVA